MSTDTTLPLLYSYRRCPYAMRARLAMLQANRRFQTFEIVMRDKPAALRVHAFANCSDGHGHS